MIATDKTKLDVTYSLCSNAMIIVNEIEMKSLNRVETTRLIKLKGALMACLNECSGLEAELAEIIGRGIANKIS